ncbi:apolipoprotein N-acyltransferase [Pseudofrancisella aestuarii]|uniref:Apolipoprotein N-acyltransferase n=1 Tax=Pseudofrancisella aestuarii TaxID=2670347 RepID=A0ABV9T9Y5_9GAMM|nr:apolipoprotein N-acyltransferase [Pseudofrancisella aestuarii]
MKKNIVFALLAFISGASLTLAFAPFRIDFLAILALCLFFYLVDKSEGKLKKSLTGLFFGLGFFSTSVSWVYISISLFTQSLPIGVITAIALIILLSFLLPIPFVLAIHFLVNKNSRISKIILYPALWTLFEIFKANVLWGGFPWVSLGYSQTESPLIWYSAIGGVYFSSYIVAFIAILINQLILTSTKNKNIAICAITVVCLYIIGYGLSLCHWYKDSGSPQKVVLVQGDFVQGFKWDYNNFNKMKNYYKEIANKYSNSIIFLPENAIPAYREYTRSYFNELNHVAKEHNNSILVGSLSIDNDKNYYNSSIVVGDGSGTYSKHHLVPFGEYFPIISSFSYSVEKAGLSNFTPGKYTQPLMEMSGNKVANFICYEIAYPEQVRDQLQNAGFISVISDDSWFGDSIARPQHLQISQVRAIETGKYVLQTTNNGLTAIIEPNGKLQSLLPKDTQANLEGTIYSTDSYTIWNKVGMSLIYFIIILSVFISIIFTRVYSNKK